MRGFAGKQLRIDLTRWEAYAEGVDPVIIRQYVGGSGYGARLLYDQSRPGIDPLDPSCPLVLATGPLGLSQVPGGGSITLCFKSPLTHIWGESRVGGNFGPDLKKAGFDTVIMSGRSPRPVWVAIRDGEVEFREAGHMVGKVVSEKTEIVRQELGDKRTSVLCIGPAGENLVRIAAVMSDDRAAGRCGGGAVFGSKNLLAVSTQGTNKVEAAEPEVFQQLVRSVHDELRENPMFVGLQQYGTIGDIPSNDDSGDWPTRNWQSNSWGEGAELFEHYTSSNFLEGFGCYRGCSVACGRKVHVASGPYKTRVHGGAEYESITSFTSYVMNKDMDAAVHSTFLCNELGLDTISTGAMIAFAMECNEHGLLSREQVQGLDLTWGNAQALPVMVRQIAYREGLGNLLAEGVRDAARRIAPEAERFAIHVKGLEGPAHDPRSGKALGITYATSNRGMCHIHPLEGMAWDRGKLDWGLIEYGVPDPNSIGRWDEAGKGRAVSLLQDGLVLPDILGTCKFYMYAGVTVDHWAHMIASLTGWDVDGSELLQVGERAINLQRMFNVREGITPKDDRLPERVMSRPAFGRYSTEEDCVTHDLGALLAEYYEARGWDPETGVPTPEKQRELGLS